MTQQGMSTKSRHLTIPDLITIGVFTALYFVLVAVATDNARILAHFRIPALT